MFQTGVALDLLVDAVRNDTKDMARATVADKAAIAELTAWKESAMDAAMAWNQVRELVAADPSVKPDSSIPIEAARIIRQHQKGSTP